MIPTNPDPVAILLIGAKLVLASWLPTSNELNGLGLLNQIDRLSE
jgi:hypothetical protein